MEISREHQDPGEVRMCVKDKGKMSKMDRLSQQGLWLEKDGRFFEDLGFQFF